MSLFSRMAHRLTRSSKRKAEGLREETSSPLSSRKSPRRSSGTTSESSCPNIIDPIFDSPGTARNYQENPSASSSQGSITTSHSSSSRSAKSSKQRVWTRSGGSKSEKSSQVWEIVSDSPDLLPETGAGPKRTEQPGTSSETGADRTVDSDKDVTSEPDSACTTDNTKMCVNPPHPHDDSLSTLPPRNSARKTFTHRRGNKIQQLTKGNNNEQILPSPAGDASTDKPVSSLHTSSEVQADEPLIGATCAELTWGSDFQSFSQQDFINDSKDLSENEDAHHNERNLRRRKESSHTRSSVNYSIADIQINSDEDDRPHVNRAKYKTKVKSKHRACTKRRADDVKSVFLGDDCPVMSLSSDSGFHENESSALPDLKSRNPTLLDHDGFANFNFNDGVERMYERKPHLWPKLHDTSKNVFHYTSNLALGRPTFQNRQAVMDTHVMQRVADFEVVDGDQPFNCRVTTIDWHPRVDNLICIGSKHGDLGFYKVQKEDYSLLQEIKSFSGIGPGGYISAFKFHPTDDEKFYTSSLDGKVCLGNIEKDRQRSETVFLNTHSWERWFCSLDAHQTDQLLVAGRNNGWTSLMTRQGEVIWEKRLHSQKISHLEFSPRESYLLCSASLDHTVRLWDLRMMVEKKPMECLFHEKGVNSAYFSLTDGTRLATTDQFDEIRVYRAPFWHLETCIKHPHRFFKHLTSIKLKEWLEKLVPHTETVTVSRVYQRVQYIIHMCTITTPDDAAKFLQEDYCFHDLSDSLSALGLKRFHLSGAEPYRQPPSNDVTNEIVIELEKLRAQERERQAFVHKWVKKLSLSCRNLTESQMKRRVAKCCSDYKKLSKNKNKSDDSLRELSDFLKLPFTSKEAIISVSMPKSEKCKLCSTLFKANNEKDSIINKLEQGNEDLTSQLKLQLEINVSLSKDKRKIEESERIMKDTIDKLRKQLKSEVSKNDSCRKELEELQKTSLYKKNYAQKRKLEEVIIERDNVLKEKQHDNAKITSMTETISSLKKQLKTEQTMKSNYKIAYEKHNQISSELSYMLEKENKVQIREAGSSHRYSDHIRQTYYALQGEGNIAASNCSTVVATVAKHLFNTHLTKEDLPSKSTSLNFANEANVIAQHQVVDENKNSEHFMFASDATSRQKAHFLEQHLQLSNGKVLSLGYTEIASDDADTLLEKCIDIFKSMCEIYCLDNDEFDQNSLFKEVIRKLKCLMSDRASVMKSFDRKVAAFKCELLEDEDCSTHFIFCNAHFLLALSSAAEEAIRSVEREWTEDGSKLGRDANPAYKSFEKNTESAAVRLIRMVAECLGPRGDEKHGSRQEWLAFCTLNNKVSKFTSYRSNRFNNLFQNATALLLHKNDIESFLTDYVSHSNLKLQSVIADIRDKRVISNIAALSFFHIFCTEPYWQLMNSQKSYLDFPDYVKSMNAALNLWRAEDFAPTAATSVFPDFKASEKEYEIIRDFFSSEAYDEVTFCSTLRVIVERSGEALQRQLSDFLAGGIFGGEVAEDIKIVLATCPLTNLTGEHLFGDLDYDLNKRRNASLSLRSTTCMWKHNKTAQWLDNHSPRSVRKLVEKGIKYGPEWKKRHRNEKKAVQEKVKRRINVNKWKRDEKDIKAKERKLAAVNAMLDVHLVSTKEELDDLFNGPKATEKLKDQIRFRSLVLEENITLSGNKQCLYDKLLKHITTNGASSSKDS